MNRTNSGLSGRGIFFILSAVMMLGVCGTAAAAPTVRTVVHTGQQAAGVEGGMLWDYFSYSVGLDNAGGVAFYGSARSDTAVAAGVWQVDQAGEASLVLRWGQAMPELGPDVMLDYTSPPLRYGLAGHIGLSIRAERPDGSGISGQWLIHGGTREMLAQYQGPAPMAGPDATIWDLGEFSRATIDGKVVVVTRTVDDSSHQWMASMYDGGNWQVLATRPAEATNSYAEQFWNLAVNDAGQVAMVAGDHPVYVASKTPVELLFHDGDSLDAVYRTGDVAADTDGVFTNSRDVNHSLNAGGELAYRGNFLRPGAAEADEGVWLFREAVSQLVLTTGEAAPGCAEGESADWLDNPFLTDGGEVYLHARLTGPTVTTTNDNVLWVSRHGEMEVLLREGSLLADGSTLVRFRRPHINTQGQVAIDAVTSEGDGVWLVDGQGVLRRILLVGDAIDLDPSEAVADLREVVRVDFGLGSGARGGHFESQPPAWAINDRGEVLLRVGLADGTEALVVAMIPEPSAGLAALGLVALAMKRRRCAS